MSELSNTAAGVQYAQPEASVVITLPDALTTYELPVANIEYIELVVTAQLNVRGDYNKLLTEEFYLLDQVGITLTKPFTDVVTITDGSYLQVDTTKQDVFTLTDETHIVCSFLRSFTDTVSLTDAGVIDFNTYAEPGYFLEDYAGASYQF